MASTPTLSSMKVVQTTVLPSGNDPATCQRRRRVSNIFSRDLVADLNDVASLSDALVSHILLWTGKTEVAMGLICLQSG